MVVTAPSTSEQLHAEIRCLMCREGAETVVKVFGKLKTTGQVVPLRPSSAREFQAVRMLAQFLRRVDTVLRKASHGTTLLQMSLCVAPLCT